MQYVERKVQTYREVGESEGQPATQQEREDGQSQGVLRQGRGQHPGQPFALACFPPHPFTFIITTTIIFIIIIITAMATRCSLKLNNVIRESEEQQMHYYIYSRQQHRSFYFFFDFIWRLLSPSVFLFFLRGGG